MKYPQRSVGLREGFRSGLEEKIAAELTAKGVTFQFEKQTISYRKPEKKCKYTPDFYLPNGIIVETKGRFATADRQKHILVRDQNPTLDIRFVFSNSRGRISKQSSTTYSMWCDRYGFKYADKSIPQAWIDEGGR